MPSAPTTSLDLSSPSLVADPYPLFADERSRHAVAWLETDAGAGTLLTFTHAAASEVLRDRRLQRLWKDKQPAEVMEPFNLLHRNQMMENEPPVHTRLRRPVAAAFNRGHIDRLRPRVVSLATSLLDEVDPSGFDVIAAYAEPLPVLVIAELLGVPASHADDLRDWSQAIVKMYEPAPSEATVASAVRAAEDFAALVRDLVAVRRRTPADDLISDLVATDLSEDEVVASVVLLLNAGHEASVNVFGNGLVSMLRHGRRHMNKPSTLPVQDVGVTVEEMLRFDSALQLFERTAAEDLTVAGVEVRKGQKVAALLGAANRDPAVFGPTVDEFDHGRDPNPHLAFSAGIHFCLGAPLARMELTESVGALIRRFPALHLIDAESRGTFVLKGYSKVTVSRDINHSRA
ncbi:cytochrome P450 [Nocardioides sp. Kera G14]|uniref:cytochrome P450 n=1 Tax=Nocardioides sp. Kera G14 TaxID=2884264 RepID=UPI001D114BAB|nr:cytochrome P450 [Nocardioides sp. Kera G14]UDY24414.1 cytochrome P450 [Nocardioides sp. Kera G14]